MNSKNPKKIWKISKTKNLRIKNMKIYVSSNKFKRKEF